jgi:hypothetical protein
MAEAGLAGGFKRVSLETGSIVRRAKLIFCNALEEIFREW